MKNGCRRIDREFRKARQQRVRLLRSVLADKYDQCGAYPGRLRVPWLAVQAVCPGTPPA